MGKIKKSQKNFFQKWVSVRSLSDTMELRGGTGYAG